MRSLIAGINGLVRVCDVPMPCVTWASSSAQMRTNGSGVCSAFWARRVLRDFCPPQCGFIDLRGAVTGMSFLMGTRLWPRGSHGWILLYFFFLFCLFVEGCFSTVHIPAHLSCGFEAVFCFFFFFFFFSFWKCISSLWPSKLLLILSNEKWRPEADLARYICIYWLR